MSEKCEKKSRWILGKKCNVKRQIEFFMNFHEKRLDEIKVMRFYWPPKAAFKECFAVGINFERHDIRNAHVYGIPWEWVNASDFIDKER